METTHGPQVGHRRSIKRTLPKYNTGITEVQYGHCRTTTRTSPLNKYNANRKKSIQSGRYMCVSIVTNTRLEANI